MSKAEDKPKQRYLELISSMKGRGISFNTTSEVEAEAFMESNNYYFKLASYRKKIFHRLTGSILI